MESDTNCSSLLSSAISSDGLSCFTDVDFTANAVKAALQHHPGGTTAATRNSRPIGSYRCLSHMTVLWLNSSSNLRS